MNRVLIVGVLIILSCSKKVSYEPLQSKDVHVILEERSRKNACCLESENYTPSDSTHFENIYEIRCVVQYLYDSTGNNNFQGEKAHQFAVDLIAACNRQLARAVPLNIPPGNDIPAYSKPYRYVLTPATDQPDDSGIYYTNDPSNELYFMVSYGKNRNNYDRRVINKFAVRPDSFLNIFLMPHHPDSIASPTYTPRRVGIALGTSVKVAGHFAENGSPEGYSGLLNHEIGHILGLSHTWNGGDGCRDTPKNPNCWIIDNNNPPCDTMASNNMMDYNAYQNALTPCQIGRVVKNFSRLRSKPRRIVNPFWCQKNNDVIVNEDEIWCAEKDLTGDLVLNPGVTLKVRCRLSLPENAKIRIAPGAHLILDNCVVHNACGLNWLGIEIGKNRNEQGRFSIQGKVKFEDTKWDLPIEQI